MKTSVLLLGASGTIGRATARALYEAGHQVTCFLRPNAKSSGLQGCEIRRGDLSSMQLEDGKFDAVISCLASRTGAPDEAWAVEHDLQSDVLRQAITARIPHFVLLSAICVQKPVLEFQKAKLAFEEKLQASGLTWSIVRPTAFFKSLSGQIGRVRSGKPYLVFGDGALTSCKPISDTDLGRYLCTCLTDPARQNRVLAIGGPGPALTPMQQGAALFDAFDQKPRFRRVPLGIMCTIVAVLGLLGKFHPKLAAKAELARIGRYYATESMLVWDAEAGRYDADATPEFGTDTLKEHFFKSANGEVEDDRGAHAVF
ncbi:MAG: NAD(P)H-binding protein [Pseudomonadota bacterium]